jgi:hypothetical protein
MKIFEVLKESMSDDVVKKIMSDCAPYFDDIKEPDYYRLYRGVFPNNAGTEVAPGVYENKVRSDRKPKNSSLFAHNVTDEWFFKKFGIKYRSNALFCVGHKMEFSLLSDSKKLSATYSYGKPYVVLPIGEYKCIYSPKIDDLYTVLDNDGLESQPIDDVEAKHFEKDIIKVLNDGDYQEDTLQHMIERGNNLEIMIHCQRYYLIDEKEFVNVFISKYLKLKK